MASKGQKFNKYTIEQKEKILQEYYEGLGGSKALGRKYNISYRTIDTWIRKINHPELQTNSKRGRPKEKMYTDSSKHLELASGLKQGRPRKDEIIDYKERYEILKKYQAFIEARHKTK